MDSSELVYVVAEDSHLPVSLQMLHADGTLQPQILQKSSLHCASSDIAVCDEKGNDLAEDVTIEVFEYVVDENGAVFRLNSKPNEMLALNCFTSVNAASCTKSLVSEDNRETHGAQKTTFLEDSSHASVHNVQTTGQEYNKICVTETATEFVQVSDISKDVTVSGDRNHSIDGDAFLASTVEMRAITNHCADTALAFCEENPLSVCLDSSPSSNSLQPGYCSVPSSPENLCHSVPVSVSKVDLAASHDYRTTSGLSSTDKDGASRADIADSDVTVASCAIDVVHTHSTSCLTVSNSTLQLLQPCVSFSAKCCSTFRSFEDGTVSYADNSVLNDASTSCLLADSSSDVRSEADVSSRTDSSHVDDRTDSAVCMHPVLSKAAEADCAADCNLDSCEIQSADYLHQPAVSCGDSYGHSICSRSPVVEYSSRAAEQHSDDHIATVSVTDIPLSDVLVSDATANNLDHECHPAESVRVSTDVFSAEDSVSKAEMPSSSGVSVCGVTTDCDEFTQQKDNLPNATGIDDTDSSNSSQALDTTSTADNIDHLVSEASCDTIGFVAHDKERVFVNISAKTKCELQPECPTNRAFNGCRQDLLEVVSSFCGNVHSMRQRLCALHRTKSWLKKLHQNKPPICASSTDGLQTKMDVDAQCDAKYKRLRLEAVDQELTNREVLLQLREEQLDLRSQNVEQREEVLRERERLLAQYCLSLPHQEKTIFTRGSQLQSLPKLELLDHESDIVKPNTTVGIFENVQH